MVEGQKKIGELIKHKMNMSGQTIRDAADIMRLSHATLGHILTGRNAISAEAAIRIAIYLDQPIATVLQLAGQTDFLNLIAPLINTQIPPSQRSLANQLHPSAQNPYLDTVISEIKDLSTIQLKSIITTANAFKETAAAYLDTQATPYTPKRKRKIKEAS